jgi:thioredoxin-like negative regulator of GroEL|tara:strand:- start:6184 stop:6771 length:588 start_codon:yes stop_codon:yes gene_type:complete
MFSNKLFSIIFISLILEIATSVISPNPAMSQLTLSQQTIENQENNPDDISDFNNFRPLTQDNSLLSLQGGEKLMNEASSAINQENYDLAVAKLRQARKVFNQLSNFHLQLANSFSGIDTQVYDAQRNSALKTGQMRDSATYQLALVHRAQDQPELAVPLLVQIIRSQNPTTDLGKKSYQQLYELGFVSVPFNNQE